MASLRDTVKDYQDELRDGIAWVAFWKQGRSWNAEYFHLDMDDTLYPEDRSRLEEIKSIDPAAVILRRFLCQGSEWLCCRVSSGTEKGERESVPPLRFIPLP